MAFVERAGFRSRAGGTRRRSRQACPGRMRVHADAQAPARTWGVTHASQGLENPAGCQAAMGGRNSRGLTASAACCGVPAIFGGVPRASQSVRTDETGVLTWLGQQPH